MARRASGNAGRKEVIIKTPTGLCKMCDHDQCQVKCIIENGRLVRTESMPAGNPWTAWFKVEGCRKQQNIVELVYHPARLNYPLKRKGARGDNKWQRISWDAALDEIAEKLERLRKEYGAETLAAICGFYNEQWDIGRFMHLFGSPNIESCDARICGGLEAFLNVVTYGGVAHYGPCEPEHTKLLVVWAGRPSITNPIKWERGRKVEKLIIVDPRRTDETRRADFHLQLRPGTDAALGLGWLHVIIGEELYDKEFVEKWCHGFDRLKERVQKYPPQVVEEITWVPKEQIIESARLYARTKPAYIQWGTASGYFGLNAGEAERVRCALRAITGNLDVPGGNVFLPPHNFVPTLAELELPDALPEEQKKKTLGAASGRFRVMSWEGFELLKNKKNVRAWVIRGAPLPAIFHAMKHGDPYPVKAAIMLGCNPIVTVSNSRGVYEALSKLELLVFSEVVMTPTSVLADYVFPVTMWIERPQISFLEHQNHMITGLRVLPKKVEGQFDRGDDYDLFRGLGIRLGQEEHWPWKDLDECYDWRFSKINMSFEEFVEKEGWRTRPLEYRSYEKRGGFNTPTGKVELYSTIFEKLGYDPLPDYEEPAESPVRTPELAAEYPYILISTKPRVFLHSSHRYSEGLRRHHPEAFCEIHPETAAKHGIKEGDYFWIETKRGRIYQKARLFDGMDPRVINPDFGWWYPEEEGAFPNLFGAWRSNSNVLTSDDLDHCGESCGNWYLGVVQAKIYRCEDGKKPDISELCIPERMPSPPEP